MTICKTSFQINAEGSNNRLYNMFFDLYNSVLSSLFAPLTKQRNLFYTLKKLIPKLKRETL